MIVPQLPANAILGIDGIRKLNANYDAGTHSVNIINAKQTNQYGETSLIMTRDTHLTTGGTPTNVTIKTTANFEQGRDYGEQIDLENLTPIGLLVRGEGNTLQVKLEYATEVTLNL